MAPESGSRCSTRSKAGPRDHGATELDGAISEDDEGSLAWAAERGYTEAGRNSRVVLDLTAIDAPDPAPPPGVEIVTWAERPELAAGLWEVAREAIRDIPGEEEDDIGTLEEWLARDMRGAGDDPSAVFVALADGEVVGFAKLSLLQEPERPRVPRPHRRQARAPPARDRRRAEADADRVGEGAGYAPLADLERGAQRADPPPERAARLRARAGRRVRARGLSPRPLTARSICRFASRSAMSRRLSPFSLPFASASSTFTLPSLK